MKKVIIIFFAVLSVFAISCKKSSTTPKPSPVGFWKGQYSNTGPGTIPSINYVFFLFRSDGTMREYYSSTDTTSTNKTGQSYTVVNDSIVNWSSDYGGGATYSYSLVIRNNSTKMFGSWGNASSTTNGGVIDVTKQ